MHKVMIMAGQLESKVALVTGGSSGIGRATALAFAREGAEVVIADANIEGGEETTRMIVETDGHAIFVGTDVPKSDEVERMVNRAIEIFGRLDCAFNNAGVAGKGACTADYPEDEWERVLAINLRGVWLCMKCEIPQMMNQERGSIVNTSSPAGVVGVLNHSACVASKHGVIGLTRAAALEYGQ
jgi:NAD(P)-dependent dehydrogenase (short-subunit alcohol dehydrogenase family)